MLTKPIGEIDHLLTMSAISMLRIAVQAMALPCRRSAGSKRWGSPTTCPDAAADGQALPTTSN